MSEEPLNEFSLALSIFSDVIFIFALWWAQKKEQREENSS